MATSGPNQGSSASENDTFDAPWTNIANAVSQDSSYATNDFSGSGLTNGVDITGFGTFTGIGAGDSVTAIKIEVRCFVDSDANIPQLNDVQFLLSGATRGDPSGVGTPIPTSVAYIDTGALPVSGFSTTLNGSQVNGSTFGVRLTFLALDTGQTLSIDAVRVTLTYTPSGGGSVTATPGVRSLTTTRYAPTVSAPRLVAPGVKSLAATRYAPAVSTPRLATIGKLSLTTTLYAPTAAAPRLVTPSKVDLTIASLAPGVSLGVRSTPGVASLATTTYAATISMPRLSTPGVQSLTLSPFAPAVATPRTATPGKLSITLTAFAPVASTPQTVTIGLASLSTTLFAPAVSLSLVSTPNAASLSLTSFAPVAVLPRVATLDAASLAITAFTPTVVASNPITATPGTRSLSLTTYSPTASLGVAILPGGKFRRPSASLSRIFARLPLGRAFHRPQLGRTWRYFPMPTNSIPATTLTKAVADDRYYLCDLTKCPEIVAGATVASAEILGGTGLTIGSPSVLSETTDGIAAGKGVKVQISGGTDDDVVSLACKATLNTGSVIVVPVKIAVAANYE